MNTYEIDYLSAKPADWETKKFRQVFDFFKGLGITKDNLVEEGIPVISYGQVHSKDNSGFGLCDALYRYVSETYLVSDKKCLVKPGDFIFADTSEDHAGVGNCAYIDKDETIFAGYHSMVARPSKTDNYYGKYFAFLFMTDFWRSQIRSEVMGIKVFSITQKLLRDTVVIIPPVAEQQAIADFLDDKCSQIDGIIADIEKQIEILKNYKKSLITETVTKGLDKNAKMKDSGVEWIGQIPEHWDVKRIKYLLDGIKDGTHGTYDRVDEGHYLLSAKNVFYDGIHIGDNESLISESDYLSIIANGYPQKGDVLLCCVGTIGRTCVYTNDQPEAFQRSVIFMRPNNTLNSSYLCYSLQTEGTSLQENMLINKTAQDGLYMGAAKEICIAYTPDILEQDKIVKFLDSKCAQIDTIITTKQTQLAQMQQHKKSLIYEYVTGKKRVTI